MASYYILVIEVTYANIVGFPNKARQ